MDSSSLDANLISMARTLKLDLNLDLAGLSGIELVLWATLVEQFYRNALKLVWS